MQPKQEYGFNIEKKPVNPGDGFEIVPKGEYQTNEMEHTFDGIIWNANTLDEGDTDNPVRCYCGILAFRRPIKQSLPAPVEQSPWREIGDLEGYKNTEWVILGRICKDYGNEFQWIKTESEIPSGYTHWQPIAPVPKPVKPMTEEEALKDLESCYNGYDFEVFKQGWKRHIEFIKKGGGK